MKGRRILPLLVALGVAGAGALFLARRQPSHGRAWSIDQSVLPTATFTGDSVRVEGVRNFRWTSSTAFTPAWETRTYDLRQIATAWYVVVPFGTIWRGPAHAFVSFGFDDGQYLAISIEARRETKEVYGVVAGALRNYELVYVVGDEQDMIGRRAVFDGTEVNLYPIRAERSQVREMFVSMLQRADAIRARPEFYNTFTNNCTLNLVHHVNALVPGRIPSSWRIALPGYSDAMVHDIGLMDTTLTVAEARTRYRINQQARAALGQPDFSSRIRLAP
ncbi:MAG: DUF4105 domain-containing protein [Gemmatimonadales bacterium]